TSAHSRRVFFTYDQVVTFLRELLPNLRLHSRFNQDVAAHMISSDSESRRFQSSLYVHSIIHHVRDELRVRQRLVGAAHNPKSHVNISMLHEGGNDRMKRPLARSKGVQMFGIEREESAPVLQSKAHSVYNDPGPEAGVIALDQRSNVAVFIDGS